MTNPVRWLFSTIKKGIGTLYFIFGAIARVMGTCFSVLIRMEDSSKLMGAGAAILAAFLALAGAAWSLDLPDLLCFFLFEYVYLFYVYILIWGAVYENTLKRIRETWLFKKMKRAFTLEGQAIMFFFKIGFLLASFVLFVWSYKLMFGEVEKGNLVNPLQVCAQVSCFLFNCRYPARARYLLLLCFFLSLLSTLHLKGIDGGVLSFVLLLFFIVICFFPKDYAHLVVFFGYFLDQELAKWGFFLAFQQVGYLILSLFFERGQSSATPKKRIFSFLVLVLIQTFYGLVNFGDFDFAEPLKLAALLSGACIIFISLAKREMWAFLLPFLLYFFLSIFIGVISAPGDKATIWGIPHGLIIFIFLHIWAFFGWFFFKDILPRKKQSLVPLFFGGVFFFLGYFPELAWLEKWIKGIDLLLLVLGLFSFIEGEESSQRHPN